MNDARKIRKTVSETNKNGAFLHQFDKNGEKTVYKYTDQKEKNKKSMGKDHKTAEKYPFLDKKTKGWV